MWAISSGTFSWTATVGIPTRTVTAQASLARVDGRGSAKAFIRSYCYQHSSDQVLCPVSPDADSADSVVDIYNAISVTFEVQVRDAYAYATGLVFFHS